MAATNELMEVVEIESSPKVVHIKPPFIGPFVKPEGYEEFPNRPPKPPRVLIDIVAKPTPDKVEKPPRPKVDIAELIKTSSDEEIEKTEEELAEEARKKVEKGKKRALEKILLHHLGKKLIAPEVSDLKIHFKIKEYDWRKAMDGPSFMSYLDAKSQEAPLQDKYNKARMIIPPKFNSKVIGHYFLRLGMREFHNECRWIEEITSMRVPKDENTVEHFINMLAETMMMEENEHVRTELRDMTPTQPTSVSLILQEWAENKFFKRNLIMFSAALDHGRLFHWRRLIQENYIMSFHLKYTDIEFHEKIIDTVRKLVDEESRNEI